MTRYQIIRMMAAFALATVAGSAGAEPASEADLGGDESPPASSPPASSPPASSPPASSPSVEESPEYKSLVEDFEGLRTELAESKKSLKDARQIVEGISPGAYAHLKDRIQLCRPAWVLAYDPTGAETITKSQALRLKKGMEDWKTADEPTATWAPDSTVAGPKRCYPLGDQGPLASAAQVYSEDILVVSVFKDSAPVRMDKIESITITSRVLGTEETAEVVVPNDFEAAKAARKYFLLFRVGLEQLGGVPGDRIEISVSAKFVDSTKTVPPTIRFVDLKTKPVGYGIRKTSFASRYRRSPIGVWFPIGLVGAHFKAIDDRGLSFSSVPIGIALGSKFHYRGTFIGVSAMLGYSMFSAVKEEPDEIDVEGTDSNGDDVTVTQSVTETTSPFAVTGVTPGVLIDFGKLFMLGVGYTFDLRHFKKDLRDTFSHPGVSVFLGLPIGLNRAN